MENISLKVTTPTKIIKDMQACRVVIPAYHGDMTILKDRAPSSVLLKDGVLQIWDADGNPIEKYFVKGGVADIAQNKCIIASERVIPVDGVTMLCAKPRFRTAIARDKHFYQMIIDHIFLRRLTRVRTRTEFQSRRARRAMSDSTTKE